MQPSIDVNLDEFLDQLKPGQVSTMLMDMLPDTITYIKDVNGVYLHVNRAFTETLNMEVSDIAGNTDLDLYGAELAETYMHDDHMVCSTATAILEKAELVTYRPGIVRWYITSKIPLRDRNEKVVGMAGLSRPSTAHRQEALSGPLASVSRAVEFIYSHMSEMIGVEQLAGISGLSVSSLERYFKKHFGSSPGRFVLQVKMSRACELLADPSYSIAAVGEKLGYRDPVVFSRVFKREMRMNPTSYRKSLKLSG